MGKKIINFTLALLTVDRRESGGVNYLDRTMESLERSGLWDQNEVTFTFNLFNSGGSVEYLNRWRAKVNSVWFPKRKLSMRENYADALKVSGSGEADWVILLEDDVEVCSQFIQKVVRCLEKVEYVVGNSFRVITLYCPYELYGDGIWPYPIVDFYGTQCWVVRRDDALSLGNYFGNSENVLSLRTRTHLGRTYFTSAGDEVGASAPDFLLKDWHWKLYPQRNYFGACIPSLVQHIGKQGSNYKFHESPSYIRGENA